MTKTCNEALAELNNRQREVWAFEARGRLLGDELDLLKRCMSPNCKTNMMTCKATDVQGDTTDIVTGSHQDTVSLYDFNRRGVDGTIVKVSRRLKEAFDRKVRSF